MKIALKIWLIMMFLAPYKDRANETVSQSDSKLREFRNIMLDEINFARTQPAEYAKERLLRDKQEGTDNGAYTYMRKIKAAKELKLSKKLNEIASDYAAFMARKDKFSHTADGTPFTRAKKAGYTYTAMGENIACGNDPQLNGFTNPESSAREFVKMLIIDKGVKDLGHRHTIMNPLYKSVGIGFGHNPKSYCINYVVQDFGNP